MGQYVLTLAYLRKPIPMSNRKTGGQSADELTTSQILLCSGVSKMCASLATYPHEVVRTRLQIQRRLLGSSNAETSRSTHSNSPPSSTTNTSNSKASAVPSTQSVKQPSQSGVIAVAKNIVTKEGWRGLYKGFSVNLFRTVPNSAVTMLTYVVF